MSKELVISSDVHETRVAILEDDQLAEIYFQRANEYSLAGSIHKGRVTRVLPGMQSAFVDLGLERDTFLYVSDFFEENGEDFDRLTDERPRSGGSGGRERGRDRDRDRDRDRERQAAPAVAPTVAPIETDEPPEATPAVADAEGPAEAAAPTEEPAGTGEDGQDRGDRRGRRSRRRRSRGRGFPDSKYASDLGTLAAEAEEAEGETDEVSALTAEPAREVFLLPGESLAKYRVPQTVVPSEDDDEIAPPGAFQGFAGGGDPVDVAPVDDLEPDVEVAEDIVPAPEVELELAPEREPETALDEAPPRQEPVPTPAPVEEPEEEEEPAPVRDPEVVVDDDDGVPGVLLAEESDDEAAADDEFSEEDTLPVLLDSQSGEPEEVTAAIEEAVEVATAAAPQTDGETGSASVREGGGRYPHRMSRRMRRKRGGEGRGDGNEARTQRDREGPVAAAPVAPVEERDRDRDRESELRGKDRPPLPSISDLLREGQEIIVQIAKEPLGQKGARITSHIALPGRFVVFMPTLEHFGVSRKIASDEERQRLKRILQASRTGIIGGFIVRTAGEGRTEEEIAADMQYLYNLWLDIRSKAEKRRAPALLHHDLDIVHRILRDQLNDMFKAVWIDNEEVYESVLRFMQRFQPTLVSRVKLYTRPEPIFDNFGISAEIEKALRPKVWLKSGGYIVINQTEALVAIDINTGKFVGKSNRLEDTITKTNTEAVKEIVRQIRLRDLGGIIVIDFIDMDERKNRQKVMQALEEAMRADRAPNKILQFNDFGLVAITRKRVKQSLERSLCAPCPVCEGAGYTKSVATVVGEIIQEAQKVRKSVEGKNVVLRVYPEVAKFLKSHTNKYLEEIEGILGRPVVIKSDGLLHPEKFDLAW